MDFLTWTIDVALRYRLLVVALALGAAVAGGWAVWHLDLDAFPDTTPVQVQINTVAPALGPEEVERQITFPLEQVLGGLPGLVQLRSISKFGLSQLTLVFEDGTDIYFARQVINERLTGVVLPNELARPRLGPVSSGLGEVFHYVVWGQGTDKTDLRTWHDWVVRPPLRQVDGVAEVNSWGGYERQFEIRPHPERLLEHGLSFTQLVEAVQQGNLNVGGGNLSLHGDMLLVQGVGRTSSLDAIGSIVVASVNGVPIRVRDVAEVAVGHNIRHGAVTANGRGEAVLGLGFMLMGQNSHQVSWGLKHRLDEVAANLPPNVRVTPVYDRTELVSFVIDTVRKNLFEGGLLVIAVLFAFLGNLRAAAIVALAIPLSMLFAACGMLRFGIAASLLSLGAIDFGMIVDSSVVMVENCVRQLASGDHTRGRLQIIRDAAIEVRRPTLFGELIIMIVYLPILTLEGVEGKLFRPMALTVVFALAGSMVLSMTLMPVLASYFLPRQTAHREPLIMRLAHRIYQPVLRFAVRQKAAVLGLAFGLLWTAFVMIAPHLGTEFVPRLSEGAVAIGIARLVGTDLSESIRYNTRMEQAIRAAFPDEVAHVWSRIGTAEVATDPMGIELTDLYISLTPRSQWKRARTQDEFTEKLDLLLRDLIGQRLAYSQPIELRLNEITSGIRADLGVKLFGDDFEILTAKAEQIAAVLRGIPGAADVAVEPMVGQPMLRIELRQDQLARHGISARTVLDVVEAIGGKQVGEVTQGEFKFPLVVRLPEDERASPAAVGAILLPTASGEHIPLSQLAKLRIDSGVATIVREWGQRRIAITANVRGRDLGSFVAEARQAIARRVALPAGRYRLEYGGQFEHYQRARTRLLVVVPLALGLIFTLLYLTYQNVVDALRVFTGIPFAWVGGIFALWLRDMPFSVSAGVGFVAMSGVAVLDDMILVSYIRDLRARGLGVEQAVMQAAVTRLRPVLMTALVAALGFLPMATSQGMGAEVQRPLATVVIGGVLGSMVMSLLVLRVLYLVFSRVGGKDSTAGTAACSSAALAAEPAAS
jgi:cobalt-zinc-cadmium resistance protein CzcA